MRIHMQAFTVVERSGDDPTARFIRNVLSTLGAVAIALAANVVWSFT